MSTFERDSIIKVISKTAFNMFLSLGDMPDEAYANCIKGLMVTVQEFLPRDRTAFNEIMGHLEGQSDEVRALADKARSNGVILPGDYPALGGPF